MVAQALLGEAHCTSVRELSTFPNADRTVAKISLSKGGRGAPDKIVVHKLRLLTLDSEESVRSTEPPAAPPPKTLGLSSPRQRRARLVTKLEHGRGLAWTETKTSPCLDA
ncbi:hypothetical protein GW17_00034152 [Ensete ventricosum]|nr:hypothetical protein GW17_00034152 [Ensete ventricosum]